MKNKYILVVDDSVSLLKAVSRNLRKQDFFTETAENADDALEILSQTHIQLIISDHNMPGMTGLELLSKVKELYPRIIRILLTGQTDLTVAIEAINSGDVFRYIAKPVDSDELATIIHQCLDYYQMRETIDTLTQDAHKKNKELAKLNKELAKNNEFLSSSIRLTDQLLDRLPVAVILVQSNLSLFFANKAALKVMPSLIGYAKDTDIEEILPADVFDAVVTCSIEKSTQSSSRMMLDGKMVEVCIEAITDDACFDGWFLSFGTQDIALVR